MSYLDSDYHACIRSQERADRRIARIILGFWISVLIVGLALLIIVGSAKAQEREFMLRMNNADLQVLDAAINKAPLPRETTQPFINKIQAQIVEQTKVKEEPKLPREQTAPMPDANGAEFGKPVEKMNGGAVPK